MNVTESEYFTKLDKLTHPYDLFNLINEIFKFEFLSCKAWEELGTLGTASFRRRTHIQYGFTAVDNDDNRTEIIKRLGRMMWGKYQKALAVGDTTPSIIWRQLPEFNSWEVDDNTFDHIYPRITPMHGTRRVILSFRCSLSTDDYVGDGYHKEGQRYQEHA